MSIVHLHTSHLFVHISHLSIDTSHLYTFMYRRITYVYSTSQLSIHTSHLFVHISLLSIDTSHLYILASHLSSGTSHLSIHTSDLSIAHHIYLYIHHICLHTQVGRLSQVYIQDVMTGANPCVLLHGGDVFWLMSTYIYFISICMYITFIHRYITFIYRSFDWCLQTYTSYLCVYTGGATVAGAHRKCDEWGQTPGAGTRGRRSLSPPQGGGGVRPRRYWSGLPLCSRGRVWRGNTAGRPSHSSACYSSYYVKSIYFVITS